MLYNDRGSAEGALPSPAFMIFRRISYALAFQFTAVVFAILLVTGGVFIVGDIAQSQRDAHGRLQRQLGDIVERHEGSWAVPSLPPFQRERIRITDALGKTIYAGALFREIPFVPRRGFSQIESGRETFDVLTAPFVEAGNIVGYIQVADRVPLEKLGSRLFLFFVVSAAISAAAFYVGLFFARRSLHPAQEMMDRLEQFTQDASHELRTPLTAVGTSLDLALTKDENNDLIRAAKRDLKDMATLVDTLLQLARLDAFILHPEPIDVTALVSSVLDAHEPIAKSKGITITRSLANGISQSADGAMLKQVVANIVGNAIKFNNPGGVVAVTLTKDALFVHDNGPGISPEALPKIFDRFYRADAARSKASDGLGLGLSLVKRIVDMHEWTMRAESSPGKGTLFTVKF